MTTGKIIALPRWTFVGKVMSLLFKMLSRLVITFLPRSKHLLISWLQSPSAVILEPSKIKSFIVSTVSLYICYEVIGPNAMILVFWMLTSNFYLIHYQLINYLSNPLLFWGSLVAQSLKNLPAVQMTWVRSVGQKIPWRREWLPTPVFLPREFHGQRSLVGYRAGQTEQLTLSSLLVPPGKPSV